VAKSFRFNIRNYNNAFAFSSLGVHIDSSVYGPFGVYTVVLFGDHETLALEQKGVCGFWRKADANVDDNS